MTTLLLLKDLYLNAFEELNNKKASRILKIFSWFCFAGLVVVLYAFVYRLFTGFPFE